MRLVQVYSLHKYRAAHAQVLLMLANSKHSNSNSISIPDRKHQKGFKNEHQAPRRLQLFSTSMHKSVLSQHITWCAGSAGAVHARCRYSPFVLIGVV